METETYELDISLFGCKFTSQDLLETEARDFVRYFEDGGPGEVIEIRLRSDRGMSSVPRERLMTDHEECSYCRDATPVDELQEKDHALESILVCTDCA